MKKGIIQIIVTDDGRIGTTLTGNLDYTEVLAGCVILQAQVIEKMGISSHKSNPLVDNLRRQVA